MGESLVGSYMRYIRGCETLAYNTFLQGQQGELDIVAIKTEPRCVWLCEVTTHISGMLIVGQGGDNRTIRKIGEKLKRAREFADVTFPGDQHRFEVWSPRVSVGKTTDAFDQMAQDFADEGESLEFVINGTYTERIREVMEHARTNTSATSEPAYRVLQILTHLRDASVSI